MSDWYVFACWGGALGLLAVFFGWSLENWPRVTGWWANRKQRRAMQRASRELVATYREMEDNLGEALMPVMQAMAVKLGEAFKPNPLAGTVQRPEDPSPKVRP